MNSDLEQHLPSDVSQLVQEYTDSTFRIKSDKTLFSVEIGDLSLSTAPGLWQVQLGPPVYRYEKREDFLYGRPALIRYQALIFHRVDKTIPIGALTITPLPSIEFKYGKWHNSVEGSDKKSSIILYAKQSSDEEKKPIFSCYVEGTVITSPHIDSTNSLIVFGVSASTSQSSQVFAVNQMYEYLHANIRQQINAWLFPRRDNKYSGRHNLYLEKVGKEIRSKLFPAGLPDKKLEEYGGIDIEFKWNTISFYGGKGKYVDVNLDKITMNPWLREVIAIDNSIDSIPPEVILSHPAENAVYQYLLEKRKQRVQFNNE